MYDTSISICTFYLLAQKHVWRANKSENVPELKFAEHLPVKNVFELNLVLINVCGKRREEFVYQTQRQKTTCVRH